MTIDASAVGRTYPAPESYLVGREKIREFAEAIGDPNPAYRGDNAIAPPTFAFPLGSGAFDLMLADPELGLALHRIVHADQKFAYKRPIRAGDEVAALCTLTAYRQVRGMDVVTTETVLSTTAGEELATTTAVIFHTPEGDA